MSRRRDDSTLLTEPAGRGSLSVAAAELLLIAGITIGAAVLRIWQPAHLAVEHFDEGVYASNLYCAQIGNAYPFRHLYAPPLLPALLEWTLIFGGIASSVMWVNIVAGCAMAPSVWWVGRTWFGSRAGIAAASFAAASAIHIQYSRAALTDGLLCLWMLWGIYWAWRAIGEGRAASIALAGLFASLAWWTKYNGWLTLAISGAGTTAWLVVPRLLSSRAGLPLVRLAASFGFAAPLKCAGKQSRGSGRWRGGDTAMSRSSGGGRGGPRIGTAALRWGLVATIAFVGWLPVLLALQDVGGYGAVSANHAKYFVGAGGWADGFIRQAANLAHYHQGLSWPALLLAVVATSLIGPLRDAASPPGTEAERSGMSALAGWLLASWFVGLFVAVPLYSPYPRLALPWVVSVWMASGWLVSRLNRLRLPRRAATRVPWCRWGGALVLFAGALLVQGFANERSGINADRRGLQTIAGQILDWIEADRGPGRGNVVVIGVLGEPGLFYHLGAMSLARGQLSDGSSVVVLPAGDYSTMTASAPADLRLFLVAGPHAPSLDDEAAAVRDRLVMVGEWAYAPSNLVLLDEYGPAALNNRGLLDLPPIRLYRVQR
ncbi:MAG: ArnT family glycosyltransferase [Planctomycetaceae bacterium]